MPLNVGRARSKYRPIPDNIDTKKFWGQVNKTAPNGCWEWTGTISKGYGITYIGRLHFRAHRVAFKLVTGKDPKELFGCHDCDNKKCCNPKHMFLGTILDNTADMVSKNLHQHGEKHYAAKFTDAQIRKMRHEFSVKKLTIEKMAVRWKVPFQTISLICLGKRRVSAGGIIAKPWASRRRFTEKQVRQMRKAKKNGKTLQQIADRYGFKSLGSLSLLINGKRWQHIK